MVLSLLMISCGGRQVSEEELLRSINTTPMLYTVQCVAQTTVIERSSRAMDWLGQRTAIIPVEANIKAGIDLSQLKNIRISGKTVYITLPDPVIEIESTRIRNDEIVTSVAPLRFDFTKLLRRFPLFLLNYSFSTYSTTSPGCISTSSRCDSKS